MNAKASDLKKELERLFESATMESEQRSKPKKFHVGASGQAFQFLRRGKELSAGDFAH